MPYGLTNDRSPTAIANVVNGNFPATVNPVVGNGPGDISPIAYQLLNYKFPNGQYLIPSADGNTPTVNFPENAVVPGTALFKSDQAVANLDWNATAKDTVALKYYYQHDPTTAPYAYSSVAGFAQHLDAGSQVASITNTQTVRPNLSITETFGFIREKVYSTISQPFGPSPFGINTFGSPVFPGMTIVDNFGNKPITTPDARTSIQTAPIQRLLPTPRSRSGKVRRLKERSPGFSKIVSCLRQMPSGLSANIQSHSAAVILTRN